MHLCPAARVRRHRHQHSDDHGVLLPVVGFPQMAVGMIAVEVKKEAGRKELELLGQSSGARSAASGSGWVQKGGEHAM